MFVTHLMNLDNLIDGGPWKEREEFQIPFNIFVRDLQEILCTVMPLVRTVMWKEVKRRR